MRRLLFIVLIFFLLLASGCETQTQEQVEYEDDIIDSEEQQTQEPMVLEVDISEGDLEGQ